MTEQKSYTWNPADYAKNSANQYTWAKELFPKLKLQGNEALLDIGCGDGKITAEISKNLPKGRVVGVDSSSQMIKLAKSTFPCEQYSNLSFTVMDARNLSFSEKFDVAFSNAALHWILDQTSVLQGVRRSLKPQGRLLFQMAGRGNAQAVINMLNEILTEQKWKRFFEGFTFPYAFLGVEEYQTLLLEAGLEPVRAELFPRDMKFTGKDGLTGWVRTTWLPFIDRVPQDLRDEFINEIANRYVERHPADGSSVVHLDMMRLEIEAKRP